MECDTLVGRLAGLLLDRACPDVPDLHEVLRRDLQYVYVGRGRGAATHGSKPTTSPFPFSRRWRKELAFSSVTNSEFLAGTFYFFF